VNSVKHVIIFAHPNPASFNGSVATAYSNALQERGHYVVVRDLYKMGFDPCLKLGEIPGPHGFTPQPDVVAERLLLADADAFAFVSPLWFNAAPAILKGYVDRVFGMGFGYLPVTGGTKPNLSGRPLTCFTSSEAGDQDVRSAGSIEALEMIFERHLAAVCGLAMQDHVHFAGVVPEMGDETVTAMLERVRQAAQR
jgi:NAD(P)H dehydrogenase (quinone)